MRRYLFATNRTASKEELNPIMSDIFRVLYWQERQSQEEIYGSFDVLLYQKVLNAKQQLNINPQSK